MEWNGKSECLAEEGRTNTGRNRDYLRRSAKTPRNDPMARRIAAAAMPIGDPAAGLSAPSQMATKTKAKSATPRHQRMSRAGFQAETDAGGTSTSLRSTRSGLTAGEGGSTRGSPFSNRPTPGPGMGTPCPAFSASRLPKPLPSAERDIAKGNCRRPEAGTIHSYSQFVGSTNHPTTISGILV